MTTNQDNILSIYQLATAAERVEGTNWYSTANQIAISLADRYEISEFQAIGVIAALSPRNKWSRNVADSENLITVYIADPESAAAVKVCTFGANKAKAIKILGLSRAATLEDVLAILRGAKLREFALCIAGFNDVCIDGHAYCIWNGGRTGLAEVPAIGVKLRRQIKADYQAAAADLGLTPSTLQAVTWCAWRRIHGVTK